ncbi:MAG: peptide chain release factor 1 [Planctomycetota bacterium]
MAEPLPPRIVAKLDRMVARLDELTVLSADPAVLSQPERMAKTQRELGMLRRKVERYQTYRSVLDQLEEHRGLLGPDGDPELRELAESELPELESRSAELADQLIDDLLAEASQGTRNAIVEIRAGTGGEEAALWSRDLLAMYTRYCESRGWKIDLMSMSRSEMDGCKEVVFSVSGEDVFKYLRFESGGHRVQRVPATESQGRVHTSAATVAVLAEAEEVEVEIKDSDLEMQAVTSSGPGGQNVNKVASAVRLTHKPSGLVVFCQEERSQHKNRTKALKLLRSRLYEQQQAKVDQERAAERKAQVGSGDRSARIRTYNFPQNRVTDHRIQQNYTLDQVVEGRLEPVLAALLAADRRQRIEEL